MLTRPDRTGQPARENQPGDHRERPAAYRLPGAADMNGEHNWRLRAACRDADPELFFPEGSKGPALESTARAKQLCAACPVRARCLDWALTHGAHHGVWGGRTEDERRAARTAAPATHPRVRKTA